MKICKDKEDFELDCYLQILNYFQEDKVNKDNTEIWKDQSLLKLMNLLENKKNRDLVTNALILILSLFEDIPPDIYNNRGVDINRISNEDRKALIGCLEDEFLPN
jgi:hypothetical protein